MLKMSLMKPSLSLLNLVFHLSKSQGGKDLILRGVTNADNTDMKKAALRFLSNTRCKIIKIQNRIALYALKEQFNNCPVSILRTLQTKYFDAIAMVQNLIFVIFVKQRFLAYNL